MSTEKAVDKERQSTDGLQRFEVEGVEESELHRLIEEETRSQIVSYFEHESHSGPMPSPRQLAMYDAALPGTAQVIRDEFQKNAEHVRLSESKVLDYTKDDNNQNRRVAERLVWGSLISVLLLAWMGQSGVAIAVAVTTVGAVITGFLQQRSRANKEKGKRSDSSESENDLSKASEDPPSLDNSEN